MIPVELGFRPRTFGPLPNTRCFQCTVQLVASVAMESRTVRLQAVALKQMPPLETRNPSCGKSGHA